MATKLILAIQDPEGDSSAVIKVEETFDEVLDHIMPISQPSSSLEMRQCVTYITTEGNRVMVNSHHIMWAEELPDGE